MKNKHSAVQVALLCALRQISWQIVNVLFFLSSLKKGFARKMSPYEAKIICVTRYPPCCLAPINSHPHGSPPPMVLCDLATCRPEVAQSFQNQSSTHLLGHRCHEQIAENYQPPVKQKWHWLDENNLIDGAELLVLLHQLRNFFSREKQYSEFSWFSCT